MIVKKQMMIVLTSVPPLYDGIARWGVSPPSPQPVNRTREPRLLSSPPPPLLLSTIHWNTLIKFIISYINDIYRFVSSEDLWSVNKCHHPMGHDIIEMIKISSLKYFGAIL